MWKFQYAERTLVHVLFLVLLDSSLEASHPPWRIRIGRVAANPMNRTWEGVPAGASQLVFGCPELSLNGVKAHFDTWTHVRNSNNISVRVIFLQKTGNMCINMELQPVTLVGIIC